MIVAVLAGLTGGLAALTHSWIARGFWLGFALLWLGITFHLGRIRTDRAIEKALGPKEAKQ